MINATSLIANLRTDVLPPAEGHTRSYVIDNVHDLVVETTKRGELTKVEFFIRHKNRNEKRQLTGWWATFGTGQGTSSNAREAFSSVRKKVVADIQASRIDNLLK